MTRFRNVSDPQISPDGKWVAYVVNTIDAKEDKSNSHIWMVNIDGSNDRQITFSNESENSPRWSPDGKYLSFTSSRPGQARGNQVWLLDRNGGEAMQLTEIKGRLQGHEWSPDSKRLALVIGDPDPDAEPDPSPQPGATPRVPKPIVIDRYRFKQDGQGYLLTGRHTYIYLFDIATKKLERLTKSKWDESSPAWSPDGTRIAFMSNHSDDPDRDPAAQLYVAEAKPGATEKQLTPAGTRAGRSRPEWSPDSKWIAFLEGDEKKYGAYSMDHLALVAADGSSAPTRLKATEDLDRGVSSPRFSADGKSIRFLVTDDRSVYPMKANLSGGAAERLLSPPIVISNWNFAGGKTVVMSGGNCEGQRDSRLGRKLAAPAHDSRTMRCLLNSISASLKRSVFKSKDGTQVNGAADLSGRLRQRNESSAAAENSRWSKRAGPAFVQPRAADVCGQWLCGAGGELSRQLRSRAKVLARNLCRLGQLRSAGSTRRSRSRVKMGVADPDRLGVGGWSYGGILTDYLIATDNRFKAATSGAGTAFTVAFYGTDQYIIQYDHEIGPPWNPKAWETYVKISYPFLHADRIQTPTLFLGGERDFNVPIEGSQQMYQALRSLGIDTQLIIYPNENHGIQRPSYQRDRMERYLAWYEKYIKKASGPSSTSTAR